MIYDTLYNIFLGIIGGIISSVIVSRVFLLQGENQKDKESLELGFNRIEFLHGMVQVLQVVLKLDCDSEIEKNNAMKKYGYKNEDEYYASKKDVRWIDAEGLEKDLIEKEHAEADKVFEEIRKLGVKSKACCDVVKSYFEYVEKIKAIKIIKFSELAEANKLYEKAKSEIQEYNKNNKKRLLTNILTDKVMIILYLLIFVLLLLVVLSYVFGW